MFFKPLFEGQREWAKVLFHTFQIDFFSQFNFFTTQTVHKIVDTKGAFENLLKLPTNFRRGLGIFNHEFAIPNNSGQRIVQVMVHTQAVCQVWLQGDIQNQLMLKALRK